MRVKTIYNSSIFRARFIAILIIVFACAFAVNAQEDGPAAVSSNGVTISFQNDGGDASAGNGVTVSFQNDGGDAKASSGVSISFQNEGSATSGATNRGVSIGFGSRANNSFYYGRCSNCATVADPVNTATGNFTFDKNDLTVAGRGFGFEFRRFYNSQDSAAGSLGAGWTHSYDLTVTENVSANTATVRFDDGHEEIYDRNGANFTPKHPGIYNKLVKNADNTYSVTRKDKRRYNFGQNGKLTAIVDRNDNAQTLDYDRSGRLSRVDIAGGRTVDFSYDAQNRIRQISDSLTPLPRSVIYEYDSNNNLAAVTDPNGNTTRFTYDAEHQMLTAQDGRGNFFVTNVYDEQRRVVSYQSDAKGNRTDFTYDFTTGKTTIKDAAGKFSYDYHDVRLRLIRRQDRLGNGYTYTYDENNNRTSVTDKNGNPTLYEYDASGNVKKQTGALGKTVIITYENDDPVTRTDESGNLTTFEYDAKRNLTRTIEPLNKITEFTYDVFGQLKTVKDALERTTTNNYDDFGNVTSTVDALMNQTVFTYDSIGRRVSTTDARQKTTFFEYDASGNLTKIIDPMLGATRYEYDANDNRTKITDARGNISKFEYDENNLLKKTIDAKSGVIENFYDRRDRRIAVKDARNKTTAFEYDDEGRLIKITDPLADAIRFEYDAQGNRTKTIDPKTNATVFAFDALNRLISTTDALGNRSANFYDSSGRVVKTVDANNKATRFFYDSLGRLVKVIDANDQITEYEYDPIGNRTAVITPNVTGVTISRFTYDELNRLKTKINPLNKAYVFTYDAVGNLTGKLDPNGKHIAYTYDGNNRLTRIDYPNSTFVSFVYDANGNRTQMTDPIGVSTYVYDELDRLTSYTDAYGKNIGYEYDANGNRTALIYPDGKRVAYTFDAANRLTRVSDWANRQTNYSYDAASLLSGASNANGTTADYAYDAAGRIVSINNKKSNAGIISSYNFTLDAVGNRTNVDQTEPIRAGSVQTNADYAYNAANGIQSANSVAFTSDDNGNLRTQISGGATTNFIYDYEDRLTRVSVGAATAQSIYNGAGQRLAANVDGEVIRYIFDPTSRLPRLLAETDSSGNITNYYVHGLGLIAKITPDAEVFQYHFDVRGSTVAITDQTQRIVNRYAYDSFGATTAFAEQTANPFRYTGQFGVTTEPNGLLFAARRFYNPSLGRFLTKDAAEISSTNPQTINEYVYSLNNPIVLIDPSGLSGERDGKSRFETQNSSDKRNNLLLKTSGSWKLSSVLGYGKKAFDYLNIFAKYKGVDELGPVGDGLGAAEKIIKAKEITDDLQNSDYVISEAERRYQTKSGKFKLDDLARGSYGRNWDALSYEEKKNLADPNTAPDGITIQIQLGGVAPSGFNFGVFIRRFFE